jgi:hypothetical protein
MRRAEVKLVRGRVFTDEIGDLMHLRDPAIGFRRHLRQAALEPSQNLRLARLQLGEKRIPRSAARCREHHHRAQGLGALGDAGIGKPLHAPLVVERFFAWIQWERRILIRWDTPTISSALFSSPAPLSSSNDFEMGSNHDHPTICCFACHHCDSCFGADKRRKCIPR